MSATPRTESTMSRWVVSYFITRGGRTEARATTHLEGCPTLDLARRQMDEPPSRIQRPSVVEEHRYLEVAARSPMAEPVEHRCCQGAQEPLI